MALTRAPGARADVPASEPAPSQAAKERAKVLFARGQQAFKEGRFKDAVDAFLDADRAVPSPGLSFNAALAYEKLGDNSGALRFFRAYLRQSPNAEDREKVAARITELEAKLQARGVQQVTVLSEPRGATVIVDEQPVGVTPWTGELLPGEHDVRLRLEGHEDQNQHFDLPAHRAIDVKLSLVKQAEARPSALRAPATPPPRPKTPEPKRDSAGGPRIGIATWTAFGVGAAALAGAGVFEVLRARSEEDVKTERTRVARLDANDQMESRQTTARVLAGVGGVAVLAGGVLLYFDLTRSGGSAPTQTGFGLGCHASGCSASYRGAF
ncbi:MAG: PEGA domain-containing protein [Polyangiaceae bacterium]